MQEAKALPGNYAGQAAELPRAKVREYEKLRLSYLILAASFLLSLLACEGLLRLVIFKPALNRFLQLKAEMFARYDTENYWKLEYRLERRYPPPSRPHPLLGWVGQFDPATLLHVDAGKTGARRPVLLYGDSFAGCSATPCFQDLLNGDAGFAANKYLLNYGVPGYGIDQIYLLFSNSVALYKQPLVVISFLTEDADRSVLPARTGQKPYFALEQGRLTMKGFPLESDPGRFYNTHPPESYSFFWSRFVNSRLMPKPWADFVLNEKERREYIADVNSALIHQIVTELRRRQLQFFFVVFHSTGAFRGKDWRNGWLWQTMTREQVPFIWSYDKLQKTELPVSELFIPNNGHPTAVYNQVLASEMKKMVEALS